MANSKGGLELDQEFVDTRLWIEWTPDQPFISWTGDLTVEPASIKTNIVKYVDEQKDWSDPENLP